MINFYHVYNKTKADKDNYEFSCYKGKTKNYKIYPKTFTTKKIKTKETSNYTDISYKDQSLTIEVYTRFNHKMPLMLTIERDKIQDEG